MSLRHGAAALALALGVAAQSSRASATTASVFGIGPRSASLAGAGATQALGYEATFVNPAGLALTERASLSAGYGVVSSWLYWQRGQQAESRVDTEPLQTTELGFTLPLWFGSQRLVLGFASLSPGGSVARAALPLSEEPQFPLLRARLQALDFDLALGARPLKFLALGLGLRALSTLAGTAEVVRGKKTTSTRVNDTLEPVLAPTAGVSAFLGDESTLSFAARAPLRADFDIQLAAVDLGATRLPALDLAGVAHYDPWALTLEYAQRLGRFTGLFGASYQRFGDTPTLLPRTVDCPPERPECLAPPATAPGFHDTVEPHVGVLLDLPLTSRALATLRAGYRFVPSPIPEQSGPDNLLDNTRHRLSFGYGLVLSGALPPVAVDGAVTLDQLVSRTHHKAAGVAASNAGAPTLSTHGHVFGLSLGVTVRL